MMKRFTLYARAVLTAVVCAAFLTACQRPAPAAEAITYGIATEPDHLDPFQATSADSRVVLFNLFEGLFKPTPEGTLIPAVAKSHSVSDDARVWTITLRDGVQFHDGRIVTVEDVIWSLNKAVEYKLTGMEAVEAVEAVEAAGSAAVVIRLKEGDREFAYNHTGAIVPANYDNHNAEPVGTGPFKFVSFTPQQQVALTKHEGYWNPALPKVKNFTFKIKSDYNSIFLDLKAGTLDAGTIDPASSQQIDQAAYDLIYENINAVQIFCLNNAVPPLDNAAVRQAISHAVSVDEIIALAHNGHAERAASPVIPALKRAYAGDLNGAYPHDLEKARSLLAQAGLAAGFDLEISVPSNYESHVNTAQVIAQQLAALGIRVSIKLVDWPTWISEVYTARRYQATVISIDGVTLSPRSYLFRYETGEARNFINYSNPRFDDFYRRSLVAADEEARTALYKDMQRVLSDDAASVFICDISSAKAFRKGIKGFQQYPLYVFDASTLYMEEKTP